MLVEVQVLKLAEGELALSDAACLHVDHIIVVWRSINCIRTVGDADHNKLRWPHLPHIWNLGNCLAICYLKLFSNSV